VAYIQYNTPAPNKIYAFTFDDFQKAMNNRSALLNDNEGIAMNLSFVDDVLLETRDGQMHLDDFVVEGIDCIFLDTPIKSQASGDSINQYHYHKDEITVDLTTSTQLYINGHDIVVGDVVVNTMRRNKIATVTYAGSSYINISPAMTGTVAGDTIRTFKPSGSGTIDVGSPELFVMNGNTLSNGDVIKNVTRNAYSIVNVSVNEDDVVFIDEYKPHQDSNVLLRSSISKLYLDNVELSLLSGKPHGVNHMGYYLLVDGNKMYAYGHFPQATSVYETVVGTPIDDYCLMEVVSPDIGAARLGTEHTQGVLNVDYNNFIAFYVPCENEFIDEFSGANVLPDSPKYIVSHKGRLFLSGAERDDDNVYISAIDRPFYFPVYLPIQINPDSDKVTGLIVYDDSIIVARQTDIYVISGDTNRTDLGADTFSLRKLNSHTGVASNDAMRLAHNYLFFLGSDGNAYSLSSAYYDSKTLSTTLLSRSLDIFKDPINISREDLSSACSIFFDDLWYVAISDKVLIYSYRRQSWTVHENINAKTLYLLDNKLIWGTNNGRISCYDKERCLDYGKPYQSYWWTKITDVGHGNNYKFFKECFIIAHTFKEYSSDIRIVFEIDYMDMYGNINVDSAIAIWGRARFGDRFITKNIMESFPLHIGQRGRRLRIKLYCSYYQEKEALSFEDLPADEKDNVLYYIPTDNSYWLHQDDVWTVFDPNQRMRLYQISGDYEMRTKR
jgi:hypothetical protein